MNQAECVKPKLRGRKIIKWWKLVRVVKAKMRK
jgi:hypothetical protein